jgi:hypothetical protein
MHAAIIVAVYLTIIGLLVLIFCRGSPSLPKAAPAVVPTVVPDSYSALQPSPDRRRAITTPIPLLLICSVLLAACATAPDYGVAPYPAYGYYEGYPSDYDTGYGSLDFDFDGSNHLHHDRDFDHGPDNHGLAQHAGRDLARVGGHGFAGNFGHGFAGHNFAARGGFGGHRG